MQRPQASSPERRAPRLRRRAVVFGVLLLVFGLTTFFIGLGTGITKSGLPPERHPVLLLQKDDVPLIRDRLTRSPYREWRRRLERLADTAAVRSTVRARPAVDKARDAKLLAFAYTLTGEREYAEQAATVLTRLRGPAQGGNWRSLDDMVQGAADLALSYDLLAPQLRAREALEAKTRLALFELGDELYRSRYSWPSAGGHTRDIRQYAALGLCALSISDYPPPPGKSCPTAWYRRARERLIERLDEQTCRDGAYAEGPGRQLEAAQLYLSFFISNSHVTGENLLPDETLEGSRWSVRIRMPNGLRPNLDSSALTPSHSYALTWLTGDAALFRWDAKHSDLVRGVPDGHLPEALAWYDDQGATVEPPWEPSQFLEASGDVVFRSDWGPGASYVLLRAERGCARTAGGVFEQPDAGSIVVAKGAEPLVLDSGYGGWSQREKTNKAGAHNLVLIDGKGPPIATALGAVVDVGVDASVTGALFTPDVSAARVTFRHNQAQFARTVISLADEHFIVADQALADKGKHEFRWLLHVNAGESTGGKLSLSGHRGRVRRPGADLAVFLASPDEKACRLYQTRAKHYLDPEREQSHAVLFAVARDARAAQFLSVLSPLGPGEPSPSVTSGSADGVMWVRVASHGTAYFRTRKVPSIGDDVVSTDGYALYVDRGPGGEVDRLLAMGATTIDVGGKAIWQANSPQTVVLPPAQSPTDPRS